MCHFHPSGWLYDGASRHDCQLFYLLKRESGNISNLNLEFFVIDFIMGIQESSCVYYAVAMHENRVRIW